MIDITRLLNADTPVWQGDVPFNVFGADTIEPPFVSALTMSLHVGTHIDAPSHYTKGAPTTLDIPFERLNGACFVLDLSHAVGVIDASMLASIPVLAKRVLLRTGASWLFGKEFLISSHMLTEGAASFVAERGIGLLGIDGGSVGSDAVHTILLSGGVVPLEGLL